LNIRAIKEIISKYLGTDVNLDSHEDFFCPGCAYGKQHKEPFQKSERQKMKPGELIHSDVAIMLTPSVNGAKYFVTFKDDHSGYRAVYFMEHKNDTLECFKEFHRTIETKYNRSIQILHTDNGTEYINSEFKEYLSKHGITVERTAPYSPQQNSRTERDMRTIVESARAMLYNADLPMELWAEAVNTAVYILNRTVQAPNFTPLELWVKKIPHLSHIRTFGAYVFTSDILRKKLDPKSQKMILVGYDGNSQITDYMIQTLRK